MIITEKIIKSTNNNDIILYKTESFSPNSETVLFIGVTHGDEPQGDFLINKFLDLLKSTKPVINKNLIFIPCLNPDGKLLQTRVNANNVDLNRNFPTQNWEKSAEGTEFFSGEQPASEIETRFLIEVIQEYKPDCILTIHAPFRIVNFDGFAEEIAQKISDITGYPSQKDIGYPTPGSFGTYTGVERNIPTITIELPEDDDNETLWKDNKDVFLYLSGLL